jgi:hypothetical protein
LRRCNVDKGDLWGICRDRRTKVEEHAIAIQDSQKGFDVLSGRRSQAGEDEIMCWRASVCDPRALTTPLVMPRTQDSLPLSTAASSLLSSCYRHRRQRGLHNACRNRALSLGIATYAAWICWSSAARLAGLVVE